MSAQKITSSSTQERMDAEKTIQRNPHPDFNKVEASREPWDKEATFTLKQTKNPDWKFGDGANDGGESLKHEHIQIDPYAANRPPIYNYKLLISTIIPRPIGFISTYSSTTQTTNLAPFSYTQVINHDPPLFCIGFAGGYSNAKDSLKNLEETGECVINIVSEHFVEAMNACSVNAPFGVSEWDLTGLTRGECEKVKAGRVKEAVFAVECKVESLREWESKSVPGKKTGVMAVVEGVNFWVREDAINEDKNLVDPAILKPICRLGGITYGRVLEGFELPRPDWDEAVKGSEFVKKKAEGEGK